MLTFNLKNKKKYLSIISNYSSKETTGLKLSELNLKILDKVSNKDLIITIELLQKYQFNWQIIIDSLKEQLSYLNKFNNINIIVTYHQSADKPKKSLKLSNKTFNYKIILICSAKGGVGKSTICVNLALAMKMLGKKTAIVDADIYGPSTHHLLGIKSNPPQIKNDMMIPYEKHGIKLNSMGLITPPDKALIWRGPMLTKTLNNLLNSTDWGDTEYLFIDLPPGTGDVYLSLLQKYQTAQAILISTPQKISLIDVARSLDLLNKLQIKTLGIIENMALSEQKLMSQNVKNFASQYNIAYLGKIAYDPQIAHYSDTSTPAINKEELNITTELKKIAKKLPN